MIDLTSGLDFKVELRRMTRTVENNVVNAEVAGRMTSNLKISTLLQQRMNDAVAAAFGVSSSTIAPDQERPKLTAKSIRDIFEQIHDTLKVYYRVDVALPNDEYWVLSVEKPVVLLHPDLEVQFVSEVREKGYIPIALNLDDEAHRQILMDALSIVMQPCRVFPFHPERFRSIYAPELTAESLV